MSFGIFLFLILNGYKYFNLEQLKSAYIQANLYVYKHIVLAAFIYACIYIMTVFFSVPVKPFLKILAGLLFGLWLGVIVCLLSATIGAMMTFLVIKYNWGEASTNPRFKVVSRFKALIEKHLIVLLFVSRLLPIPFFVPNILAGILKVKDSIFFFTTLIGIIPVTFIYVWFGVHFKKAVTEEGGIDSLIDGKFILALSVLGVLALVPLSIKVLRRFL